MKDSFVLKLDFLQLNAFDFIILNNPIMDNKTWEKSKKFKFFQNNNYSI